jgi:hypothetical protein
MSSMYIPYLGQVLELPQMVELPCCAILLGIAYRKGLLFLDFEVYSLLNCT